MPQIEQFSTITALLPELALIEDEGMRTSVTEIWQECWEDSKWEHLDRVPKNTELPISRTLVTHSRSVALLAVAVADVIQALHDIPYDKDTLVAAALLHDVSKMYENDPNPDGSASKDSVPGRLIQHGIYGAHKAWLKELSTELVHAIITHTHSSKSLPATWESIVVHYVDYLDSDALLFAEGRPLLLHK